jgi:hypothetical protein
MESPMLTGEKIERSAIFMGSRDTLMQTGFGPPNGPLETTTAGIQAAVLGADQVGRNDSLYDFGGTSLQAIQICVRLALGASRLRVHLPGL